MRILLVDDEPINVQSLANAIRRGGHDITTLSDPFDALATYKEWPHDVVISDVKMPGMSGIDLLGSLREFDPAARVILITGYGDAKTAMAAINNRAWALLAKPISLATMMDTLGNIEKELEEHRQNAVDSQRDANKAKDIQDQNDHNNNLNTKNDPNPDKL